MKTNNKLVACGICCAVLACACAIDPEAGRGPARGEAVYQTGSNLPTRHRRGGDAIESGDREEADRAFRSAPPSMPPPRPGSH